MDNPVFSIVVLNLNVFVAFNFESFVRLLPIFPLLFKEKIKRYSVTTSIDAQGVGFSLGVLNQNPFMVAVWIGIMPLP